MTVVIICLAAIGSGVVAFAASLLIGEVVRALRQSLRVAAIAARQYKRRRRVTAKEWLRAFKREFCSGYDSVAVGSIVIPHDPAEPIRRRW